MQCTRCYSHMRLVKRENHQDSFLEWHQCPVCNRVEFISEPVRYDLDPGGHVSQRPSRVMDLTN